MIVHNDSSLHIRLSRLKKSQCTPVSTTMYVHNALQTVVHYDFLQTKVKNQMIRSEAKGPISALK